MKSHAPVKIIGIFLISWAAGLVAYLGSLALFYRQTISSGDLFAVLFSSLLVFAIAFFALYFPILLGVRRLLGGVRPLFVFPLLGVLLGVVPTVLIVFYWGGGVQGLFSPEAGLFLVMFTTVGAAVGFGFARAYGNDRAG